MSERGAQGDVVRAGRPDSAIDRVADFYGAYIDALSDGAEDLAERLRGQYLTEDFRKRLTTPGHSVDDVLHSRDVPTGWEVHYVDSGAGFVFMKVTLTWGAGAALSSRNLGVKVDSETNLISDVMTERMIWQ
ncbi:hypothetical protein [Nocardia sp. NPDC052566]|uniref:hypothetical protein n=1 Tax=Nocardia sp. NPDC052566 TaxID=3364330 RepID=UPI0037C5FA89